MNERRYNPIVRESETVEREIPWLTDWSRESDESLTVDKLKRTFADMDEELQELEGRNQYHETNWCPAATEHLRDLAIETGIALSTISRAASGKLHRYDIKPEIIAEYKRWRNVYELARRLKRNG